MAPEFVSGTSNGNTIENGKGTDSVFRCNNERTSGFVRENHSKLVLLVPDDKPMTVAVQISGGKHAKIQAPKIMF